MKNNYAHIIISKMLYTQTLEKSYPYFQGFEYAPCATRFGIIARMSRDLALVPIVNISAKALSLETRYYIEAIPEKKFDKVISQTSYFYTGFRVSSRNNFGVSIGVEHEWYSLCIGIHTPIQIAINTHRDWSPFVSFVFNV